MNGMGLLVVVQLSLISGMAGLFWPEKMMPIFEILMFPIIPTQRTLRVHSLGSMAIAVLLFIAILTARPF
jgi:hypothetical protein